MAGVRVHRREREEKVQKKTDLQEEGISEDIQVDKQSWLLL